MINLRENEEKVLSHWKAQAINAMLKNSSAAGKDFYFLDGPPYVTGDLHPGHIWVKTLKDLFVRYKRLRGFKVNDRAGYDVHGLPTENKVERELGISSKREIETKIGIENFVASCRDYIHRYIGRMDADYFKFGISLDFSNPYLPSDNRYIETGWGILKKAEEKRLLYKGKRPLTYCVRCGTPLSQGSMEVEYRDDHDPSVYVAFDIEAKSSERVELPEGAKLLIWTTTPWTLPANVSVAINPKEEYVVADMSGRKFVLAKARLEKVVGAIGESAVAEKAFYGSELVGVKYRSPLEDIIPEQKRLRKYHRVLAWDMVSMDDGSGVVHIAPGHGLDDYQLGKREKLPIFSPVDSQGNYTGEAGHYAGTAILGDANQRVISDLKQRGALVGNGSITHSYPHCWRCDTKLIYIATDQWFINVQRMKKRLLRENDKIVWHPAEARKWEADILANAPDWCISRQRYWGMPIPIWVCAGCGKHSVIGSLDELMERALDPAAVDSLKDLHRPYIDAIRIKCDACGSEMSRIRDVFDVWFDSGISFRASLSGDEFERLFPTDLVVEYIEQIRGWFPAMMKCGIIGYNRAPFRNIVVHGIMIGTDGKPFHKKLGNYMPLEEQLKKTSADGFRLWCTNHTTHLNIEYSIDKILESDRTLLMLYNISSLLTEYSSLTGHRLGRVRRPGSPERLSPQDRWIVSRLNSMLAEVTESLDGYDSHRAVSALNGFVVNDFSRFYLKIAKQTMASGERAEARKTLEIVNYVLFNTIVAFSPIIPMTAESVYKRSYDFAQSVFMERWPRPNGKLIDMGLEKDFDIAIETITAILNLRERSNAKLRVPLRSARIETGDEAVISAIQKLSGIIEAYTNIKRVEVSKGAAAKREIRPVFGKIGPAFKADAPLVAAELKNQDADRVEAAMQKEGVFRMHAGAGSFEILPEHVFIVENQQAETGLKYRYGVVNIDTTPDEELKKELFIREITRRIQMVRKEMKLTRSDPVVVAIDSDEFVNEIIRNGMQEIKETTRARSIEIGISDRNAPAGEYEISGAVVRIHVRKAEG
ncbi:MAG: isoleucine--tRNA ligase [Candidatus Micrarchaeota archaeon]|nr:isoleucine--tRNA ligase [Candidatus Micrarchaeota archaeon]